MPNIPLANPGLVYSMAVQDNGKFLCAGLFEAAGKPSEATRLNPDGSVDPSWKPAPGAFSITAKFTFTPEAIFVVGYAPEGLPRPGGISRLNAGTGALDRDWNPDLGGRAWVAVAVGTNLIVGGDFTVPASGNVPRPAGLARVAADGTGTVDLSWHPRADGLVSQLLVLGTNLFVAGPFQQIDGTPRRGLAKLSLATGAVDPEWNPDLAADSGAIRGLAANEGSVYVLGDFFIPGSTGRRSVIRLRSDGVGLIDSGWNPSLPGSADNVQGQTNAPAQNGVYSLAATNGSVFIGGVYWSPFDPVQVNRPFLVKVSGTGAGETDVAWTARADLSNEANAPGSVNALLAHESGLYVGGSFARVGGFTRAGAAPLSLARLNYSTGERDRAFQGQATVRGTVRKLARQSDGRLLVAGNFQAAGGLERRGLARVNADGQVDAQWAPEVNGRIDEMVVGQDGAYVRGEFTEVNGVSRLGLAKIALQRTDRLESWDPAQRVWTNTAILIRAMAVDGTNWYGLLPSELVRLNSTTADRDPSWHWAPPANSHFLSMVTSPTHLYLAGSGDPDNNNQFDPLLLRFDLRGTGTFDPTWRPDLRNRGSLLEPILVAVHGDNLFVQTGPDSLSKVSTTGQGEIDPAWSARFSMGDQPIYEPTGLAVAADADDESLCLSGRFTTVNGWNVGSLTRLLSAGAGLVDTNFARLSLSEAAGAIIGTGASHWYLGGAFREILGEPRDGLAFLAAVATPALVQDNNTNLVILRNAQDGPEVTHFYVAKISGPPLYRADGSQVRVGDFLTVAEGEAGLTFALGGSIEVASAVNATLQGVGSSTGFLSMVTNPIPAVRLTAPAYRVREGQGFVTVSVRKYGTGFAAVDYRTDDRTAVGDQLLGPIGADYRSKSGTLTFLPGDRVKTINIPIADDLVTEGDEQFLVSLRETPNFTLKFAAPQSATVVVVDNDIVGDSDSLMEQKAPAARPDSSGLLLVDLEPGSVRGQWRLAGSLEWHGSGEAQPGLVSGDYRIEFSPVDGHREPLSRVVTVQAGKTNRLSAGYAVNLPGTAVGRLTLTLEPAAITSAPNEADRGAWRRLGTTNWHRSDEVESGLSSGTHRIEFRPVAGYLTPRPVEVTVTADDGVHGTVVSYSAEGPGSGVPAPEPVAFELATNAPFAFNGQLRTSLGFASGFVVRPKVVLTAAHALFDDDTLSYATEVEWSFQRYRDRLEPTPQLARGWYVFDGYAGQRAVDRRPGVSTPASQNLDVAALYFLEPAGRGGYGGFVSSDAEANDFLANAEDKFLAGYPLEGVATTNRGKLHVSGRASLPFTHLYGSVFATETIQGLPGNSGGPLYVRTGIDTFYPAAVFLGGSGQSLFRAINSEVVDLINRADQSANGGGNSTGGGVTLIGPGVTVSSLENGRLTVRLHPDELGARAGWRVVHTPAFDYLTNLSATAAVVGGVSYEFEFKPVDGFITPTKRIVTVSRGQEDRLDVEYTRLVGASLAYDFRRGLSVTGSVAGTYRVEWASNLSPPVVWHPLTNVPLSGGSALTFSNLTVQPGAPRFFRAVLGP